MCRTQHPHAAINQYAPLRATISEDTSQAKINHCEVCIIPSLPRNPLPHDGEPLPLKTIVMTKGINQNLCYLFIYFLFKGSEIVKHEAGVMYCAEREDIRIL